MDVCKFNNSKRHGYEAGCGKNSQAKEVRGDIPKAGHLTTGFFDTIILEDKAYYAQYFINRFSKNPRNHLKNTKNPLS